MPKSNWKSGLAINLISNLISFIVGGIVTYFSHDGSAWVKPFLYGAVAWLVTFASILLFRVMKNMPSRVEPITISNIHRRIRDWLDKFNLTVKSVNDEESYFHFIVTTDGGKRVSVSRSKGQFSDYVLVKGLITISEEEKKLFRAFSQDELTAARLAIQLELSRAVMGYKTDNILEELTVFKRIPISSTLTEEEVFNLMWEVEAMLGTLFTVGAMAIHRHNIQNAAVSAAPREANEKPVPSGA
jgi:hypothetical protein